MIENMGPCCRMITRQPVANAVSNSRCQWRSDGDPRARSVQGVAGLDSTVKSSVVSELQHLQDIFAMLERMFSVIFCFSFMVFD